MSDRPESSGGPDSALVEVMARRIDAAVLEAVRDLKGYYARELNTQLAQMEERIERRIAEVEANLQGVNVKLVAIRDELHQSLRDQAFKFAAWGMSGLAIAVAALLIMIHWLR